MDMSGVSRPTSYQPLTYERPNGRRQPLETPALDSACEITVTHTGLVVGHPGGPQRRYFNRVVAADLAGIHADTLQRLWHQAAWTDEERPGLKIARGLFFSRENLIELGYTITPPEEE